jgi:lipopolysaccharide heptosyltransferase II
MKIVVRSPNWIGDCIMALPAIRALKDFCPDIDIYIAAKSYLCEVYKNIPEIHKIIAIPNANNLNTAVKTAKMLREYQFQAGLLFTNSFRSAIEFRMAGINVLTGYGKDLRGFLLAKKLPFPHNDRHHIHFYLDLVYTFAQQWQYDVKDTGKDYSYNLVLEEMERRTTAGKLLSMGIDVNKIIIGISPSAAYGTAKQWLPERFSELIGRIRKRMGDVPVVLFGSQKEREKITKIMAPLAANTSSQPLNVFNVAGQLSLREAFVAISYCNVFISNDSGLMHVASSLNLPLIGLFGPTRPEKTAPLNAKSKVIHYPPHCAPCIDRDCPYEDHPCMTAITVNEVFNTLKALLKNAGASS